MEDKLHRSPFANGEKRRYVQIDMQRIAHSRYRAEQMLRRVCYLPTVGQEICPAPWMIGSIKSKLSPRSIGAIQS